MQTNVTSGKNIFIVVGAAFAALVIILGIMATEVLQGPSPYKETSYVTLAFKNVDGKVIIEGLVGVTGKNPTIITRLSTAHQMILRVVNHDSVPHQFTIDGLNASTKVLETDGINFDVLVLSGGSEGTYTYRDALNPDTPLGEFRIVKVTAFG